MKVFGSKELKQDVLDARRCIGCGACINLCPYFKSYKGRTAYLFPCTLETGRCFALCPKVETDMNALSRRMFQHPYDNNAPLGSYRTVYMSKAGPNVSPGKFQSGGTASSLMGFALKTGMIDAAVLTDRDGITPVPRIVTDADQVTSCSGSKYTASPTLAALNQAISDGHEHIGVVGTPCQTLSVAKMKSNPFGEDDFKDPVALVIGLFCTWSLDYRSFEAFISGVVDIDRIEKVDIPPPPAEVFEVYTNTGKIDIPLAEIRKQVPDSCTYCPDMTSEFADISVGVLEGRPDMNTLIVRTETGEKLVKDAEKAGYLILDTIPEDNLNHLKTAAGNKKTAALGKVDKEGLLNTSDDTKRAMFRF